MNESVKEFLDKIKTEEKELLDCEKRELLIKLDIYDKEYSPDDTHSDEYCEVEKVDETNIKYYKKIYPEITDEEYCELKKVYEKRVPGKKPFIVTALIVFAWAYLAVTIISGIITVIGYYQQVPMYMPSLLPTLISSIISAIIRCVAFLGFAKIIDLLYAIKNK